MNIQEMTDEKLKSLKCEIYESNMQNAQNLQVINAELQKRMEKKEVVPEVVKES